MSECFSLRRPKIGAKMTVSKSTLSLSVNMYKVKARDIRQEKKSPSIERAKTSASPRCDLVSDRPPRLLPPHCHSTAEAPSMRWFAASSVDGLADKLGKIGGVHHNVTPRANRVKGPKTARIALRDVGKVAHAERHREVGPRPWHQCTRDLDDGGAWSACVHVAEGGPVDADNGSQASKDSWPMQRLVEDLQLEPTGREYGRESVHHGGLVLKLTRTAPSNQTHDPKVRSSSTRFALDTTCRASPAARLSRLVLREVTALGEWDRVCRQGKPLTLQLRLSGARRRFEALEDKLGIVGRRWHRHSKSKVPQGLASVEKLMIIERQP